MLVVVINKNMPADARSQLKNELYVIAGSVYENGFPETREFFIPGDNPNGLAGRIRNMNGVVDVILDNNPYRLVTRDNQSYNTVIDIRGVKFGDKTIPLIAGPCSVESRDQILNIAAAVKQAGATVLRGGAFKPRSSPYSFQGLGEDALEYLAEAKDRTGLPVVTEVINPSDIEKVIRVADILQIGSRNSQNIPLLQEIGKSNHPVILKRGMMMTIEEWLMAAEYILLNGNRNVILCERGIRTFETMTRNTLDIASIPLVRQISHLPVIVDPSHASGRRDLIAPLSLAAIASGADGLMLEVHHRPGEALSDGAQAITPDELSVMMARLRRVAATADRIL